MSQDSASSSASRPPLRPGEVTCAPPPARTGEKPSSALKVLAITLIAFLAVGGGLAVWQAMEARAKLAAEQQKLESMELSKSAERKQREKNQRELQAARREAEDSRAYADFLGSILAEGTADTSGGEAYAVREALARGVRLLDEGAMAHRPEVELKLRRTIGEAYLKLHLPAEAEPQMRHVLEKTRATAGDASPELLEDLCGLARVLTALQKPEGQQLYDEATALYDALVARQPWRRVLNLYGLAEAAAAAGITDKSIGHCLYAQDLLTRQFGPVHPHTLISGVRLASMQRRAGQLDEARRTAAKALDMLRRRLPPGHPQLGEPLIGLAQVEIDAGRFDEAVALMRECVAIRSTKLPEGHWQTANAKVTLGRALAGAKQDEEAEKLLVEGLAGLRESRDAPSIRVREACEAIVAFYKSRDAGEKLSEYEAILNRLEAAEADDNGRRPPARRE